MNNNVKRHVGKVVNTTLLDIAWHTDEIAKRFDILEVSNDDDGRMVSITDPVGEYVKGDRIWSVFRVWKGSVYVLMGKDASNKADFIRYLRSKGEGFRCDYVTPSELLSRNERALLSLLLNGVNRIDVDGFRYNNLDGSLFQTFGEWIHRNRLTALHFSAETAFGDPHRLRITVRARSMSTLGSFSKEERRELFGLAQYRVENGVFRRVFDNRAGNFIVKKAPGSDNAFVPYQDLKREDKYRHSKVRNVNLLIDRVNRVYKGLLEVRFSGMRIIDDVIPDKGDLDRFLAEMTERARGIEFAVIDVDGDAETGRTADAVVARLSELFGIEAVRSESEIPSSLNIRVIHNEAFYGGEGDRHKPPEGAATQHITVEDFGQGDDGLKDRALFNVVIKELFIKRGLCEGFDSVGGWASRGYSQDYAFIRRERRGKKGPYACFKLVMHPDGSMECGAITDRDPLFDVCGHVWPDPNKNSDCMHVMVKGDSVCAITNTGIIPVTDPDVMQESMKQLGKGRGSGGDGNGPRGRNTVDRTVYSTLDIKRLDYEGKALYFCGYNSFNITNQEKAPNIRLVECVRGENFFDEIIGEMNVPFVRYGQLTVYPYPFKYLNEYIACYFCDKMSSQ